MIIFKDSYDKSWELNKQLAKIINEKSKNNIILDLYEKEYKKEDGYLYDLREEEKLTIYPLEIKRRKDNLISKISKNKKYKYETYQIMNCYSVKKAEKENVAFIIYDDDMKIALMFLSDAINFKKYKYKKIKSETDEYHYLKMYEVDLHKSYIIELEKDENIKTYDEYVNGGN